MGTTPTRSTSNPPATFASRAMSTGSIPAANPTPIVASTIHYAIANPYWHVPDHLVRKFAPRIAKEGQAFMNRNGYEVLTDFGPNAQPVPISSVDWKAVQAGTTKVLVRQKPNSINSMGKMKFPFPNREGIYLHDTPLKEYFSQADRSLSNGCIRVEDYRRLAHWLFGRDVAAAGSEPEQHIPMQRGVPVYVTYLTMVPTSEGMTTFTDRYGWDRPGVLAGAQNQRNRELHAPTPPLRVGTSSARKP